MLSMEMSRSCSYIDGWSFLLDSRLSEDRACSLVTLILIPPPPKGKDASRTDSVFTQVQRPQVNNHSQWSKNALI